MGLKYYSNLLDIPIYSNQKSQLSSSDIYTEHYPMNVYANLTNTNSLNQTCEILYENIQNEESTSLSPIYMNLSIPNDQIQSLPSIDLETNILEECQTTFSNERTIEKFEVNIVSCSNEKLDRIRMKIPRIPSSLRRRRTLNRSRRYRCRSSTPFRTLMQSNSTRHRQHQQKSSAISHHQSSQDLSNISVANQLYQAIYLPHVNPTNKNFDHIESIEQDESIEEKKPIDRKTSSSTLVSLTNTLISSETLSSDVQPRSSRITLSLAQKDVEFIHDILQRTQGNHCSTNRIAALKQAYIRAANNRQDYLKTNGIIVHSNNNEKKKINRKPSGIASKIRDELEKYDELPIEHDSFSDDESYSKDDHYRYYHRRLPEIPSTTHRFIDFLSTLKRQLQCNFQKFRSRILLEMMSNPPRKRSYHYRSNIRPRSSSHHFIERSHRQKYSRSHSNISQMSEKHFSNRPRTFRVIPHQRGRCVY